MYIYVQLDEWYFSLRDESIMLLLYMLLKTYYTR